MPKPGTALIVAGTASLVISKLGMGKVVVKALHMCLCNMALYPQVYLWELIKYTIFYVLDLKFFKDAYKEKNLRCGIKIA
ncbi:hypothetical protein ACFP1I_06390 [Dyadobacter subterraneus]|uniref:Uncharacterized protein n=1 Tax=Dyadobacter subterraneus TaxID=2773304 RepID=A0ABR9WFG9_9BACT|nr:hypothetical protein [Dyadobacter subterraneus]MBE9464242.1 hypothetical protein [Dyadobacter subterraneus]